MMSKYKQLYGQFCNSLSNQLNQYTMEEITITEDQAMSMGIELKDLIHMKRKEGYTVLHEYQHPAVGLVVVMTKDYSLAA